MVTSTRSLNQYWLKIKTTPVNVQICLPVYAGGILNGEIKPSVAIETLYFRESGPET